MSSTASPGALHGLRVLDLSRVLAGPLCSMVLADLGADVVKVERPGSGDETRQWGPPWAEGAQGRESAYFLCVNRNKRSVEADLATGDGRALVRDLARGADVLLENFAPGRLNRWGLGYDDLAATNPGLIFCSIAGYPTNGGEAGRPGYDFAVQARAGWMAVTGEPNGAPMKTGVAVTDVLTGQNAAVAVLAALRRREVSGRGQRIEISLFESALAGLVNVTQAALITGEEPARYGNAHPTIVPYHTFETADRPLVVAVGNDRQWRRLCDALEMGIMANDSRFATNPDRIRHRDEVTGRLSERFAEHPAVHWLKVLESAGVPCAPVQSISEALVDDARAPTNGWTMSAAYGSVPTVPSPLGLRGSPARLRRPAPRLGEHNAEIERGGWTNH